MSAIIMADILQAMTTKKIDKKFVASPWVGEFGWELFCRQGFLRKKAEQYTQRPVVFCRTGHEFIYEDFADVLFYDSPSDQTDMWINRGVLGCANDFINIRSYYHLTEDDNLDIIAHNTYSQMWWHTEEWLIRQKLISFKRHTSMTGYDILLIVRDTTKCNTGFRNWPQADAKRMAQKLMALGYSVACVGESCSANHLQGTIDLRNMPLDALALVMSASRVIVGPQCGPIHFATLCELPQVTWQTKQEHALRVAEKWNPFKTRCHTICSPDDSYWVKRKMWLPLDDVILDGIIHILNNKLDENS